MMTNGHLLNILLDKSLTLKYAKTTPNPTEVLIIPSRFNANAIIHTTFRTLKNSCIILIFNNCDLLISRLFNLSLQQLITDVSQLVGIVKMMDRLLI